MPDHDWEALYGALAEATAEHSRDELVALLRDLIREYVVERGLPTGSPQQAATPDLSRMDFPQLVTWLKRHLSLPELGLFRVLDGARVIVDIDGPREVRLDRATEPLDGPAPRPAPRPAQSAPAAPAAPAPAPAPSAPPRDTAAEEEAARTQRKLSPGFRGLEFD